jgi:hypothetical protein
LYGNVRVIQRGELVNVRLDEERLRKVQTLRKSGVAISDLVREAIDERFDELSGSNSIASRQSGD